MWKYILVVPVLAALYASGYYNGHTAGKTSMEVSYAKQLAQAVQDEQDKQRAKDEERAAALKSASDWRAKYERLLKSRPSRTTDLQTCLRQRDRLRELGQESFGVVGEARESLRRLRIEWR